MSDWERLDRAASVGFEPEETQRALAIIYAMGDPLDSLDALDAAMDLARLLNIPLEDAARAVFVPARLSRLGMRVPPGMDPVAHVLEDIGGMAAAYSRTFHGQRDVIDATRALRKLRKAVSEPLMADNRADPA